MRTHGVMCRTHAARALSHTQRAHGGCFVHALFCTLWQVLTTDATFVTNPARVLGAHSAPAVVRCARCVSPTPRFASPPMRTLRAPRAAVLVVVFRDQPSGLLGSRTRAHNYPPSCKAVWLVIRGCGHDPQPTQAPARAERPGGWQQSGEPFAGARVAIEVRHRRTYSLRDLMRPPTSWRPRLRPQLSALARHRSAGR